MQHMWYELAAGRAHAGKGPAGRGPALKKFQAVVSHFADIAEDQFDFHSYCVRKGTLRSYVGMLGMMDRLYGHPFFSKVRAVGRWQWHTPCVRRGGVGAGSLTRPGEPIE